MCRWLPILLIVLLPNSLSASGDEGLLKQVQAIPLKGVDGRIDHFGLDLESKRLYVAAIGNNSLEAIDLQTGKRIESVSGLSKPTGVCALPRSHKIVVATGGDGKVCVFDPNLKSIGSVNGLDDADNVRLDRSGKIIYVGYGDGAIAVIDPEQLKKTGDIKLDGHPESFQLEKNGNRIFVNVPSARMVVVIDREKQSVIAKWPLREAAANYPMALDETDHRLFVGCRSPAKVLVLDTETGKTIATLDCCGDTDDLFYDQSSKRLYVTGGEGCISVIQSDDATKYRLLGTTPAAAGARTSIYMPESQRLYVAIPQRESQQAELRAFQPAK